MDPIAELKKMVGNTGNVASVYGGFEIRVAKPDTFPWHECIDYLIGIGQSVWVKRKKGKIHLMSEPNVP